MLGFVTSVFMLTSCSQNDILETIDENNAISFSNLNDRVTRAANDAGADYAVYAVRSETSVWFMEGVKVNGATNEYAPLRYWPTTGSVHFYAYAPFEKTSILSSTVGSLPFTYTVPSAANEDFTIATPVTASSGTVNLSFNHMLSKITVAADLTADLKSAGYSVSFTSATLGVAKNEGEGNLTTTPIVDLTAGGSPATYQGAKTYMFIPQASIGSTLQLNDVVINHNGEEYWSGDMKVYTIAEGNIAGNRFARNTHYTITFTIDATSEDGSDEKVFGDAITFSSSIAADWTTGASVTITQP